MEEIFRSDKILQFWPNSKQTAKERVYATTRFILYAACILYLIRRDVRILIMGALALGVLYYMYKNGMIKDPELSYFQKSIDNNVMNNGTSEGPPDRRELKQQWDSIHPYEEGRWFAEHNFYTAPDNTDNTGFMNGAYGEMRLPKCRENGAFCDVESNMARGPEQIQRKTYQRI
jgi:hypothetical protein